MNRTLKTVYHDNVCIYLPHISFLLRNIHVYIHVFYSTWCYITSSLTWTALNCCAGKICASRPNSKRYFVRLGGTQRALTNLSYPTSWEWEPTENRGPPVTDLFTQQTHSYTILSNRLSRLTCSLMCLTGYFIPILPSGIAILYILFCFQIWVCLWIKPINCPIFMTQILC